MEHDNDLDYVDIDSKLCREQAIQLVESYSQAENERLWKILEDYGQHTKSCESRRWVKSLVSGLEKPGKCNCGFEAVLRPEQRKEP